MSSTTTRVRIDADTIKQSTAKLRSFEVRRASNGDLIITASLGNSASIEMQIDVEHEAIVAHEIREGRS